MAAGRGRSSELAPRPRLLLIEDDTGRVDVFKRWLEGTEFVLVHVRSAGQALGFIARDGGAVTAGVMLDHDLTDATLTESDRSLSTSDVLPLLTRRLDKLTPVLIHSHNLSRPPAMERMLKSAGFSVTRRRFDQWNAELFAAWLVEVRDAWETRG